MKAEIVRQGEIFQAMAEMKGACEQLEEAARGIAKQHDPFGCLPFVLAVATGGIVAPVTAKAVRWYFVGLLSLGGAAVMFLVLMVFRVRSWSKHHPLLACLSTHRHARSDDPVTDYELLGLYEAIVRQYLPPAQSERLLAKVEDAKCRVESLLGLSDLEDEELPR